MDRSSRIRGSRPAGRLGSGTVAALLAASLIWASPAAAEKSDHVRKPPRGDLCAETPPYVAMDMLAIPIIQDGYVTGILNVKPCFGTKTDQADAVSNLLPVVQDLYVRRLHRYASTRLDANRPLDVQGLRRLLQDGADEVFGKSVPGGQVPVLVTFIAMRRLG